MSTTNDEINQIAISENERLTELVAEQADAINALRERVDRLNDEYARSQQNLSGVQREFDSFKFRVRDRMIEEAERRDWCGEFDDILVEFGLEPRTGTYDVRFEVSGTVTLSVLARNEDHAVDLAERAVRFFSGQEFEVGGQTLRLYAVTCDEAARREMS